jgi:ribosomal protein L34E
METFIRKSLGLKAHTVVTVEEREAEGALVVHVERLDSRRLRCGECGLEAQRVAPTRRVRRRPDLGQTFLRHAGVSHVMAIITVLRESQRVKRSSLRRE